MNLIDPQTQDRIHRLLGRPAMRPLIERLDRRLGQNPDLSGTLTIANCSDENIDAITGLLCKPPLKSGSLTVRLSDLDDAAVNAVGVNLVIAISELLGIQCDCAESVLWKKWFSTSCWLTSIATDVRQTGSRLSLGILPTSDR
jgi:hypothetical protein